MTSGIALSDFAWSEPDRSAPLLPRCLPSALSGSRLLLSRPWRVATVAGMRAHGGDDLGQAPQGRLRAVVFDVGETLIDETREYGTWADWLGVPRHTFSAVFGGVIARGEDYRATFQHFQPGFDLEAERHRRQAAGHPETFGPEDLYPDARPCLAALKREGLLVGVAGNQTARAEALLRELDLPVDLLATSAGWGVEKPAPAFFDKLIAACGCRPAEVAYVGDRLDNDVLPALDAGMVAVLLRRGPWGHLLASHPDAARAHLRIDSLEELPARLRALNLTPPVSKVPGPRLP